MKVYIAGPMSGVPDNNREAFEVAEARVRRAGHEPVNPYVLAPAELQAVAAEMGRAFNQTREYEQLIENCLWELQWCEGICMLDGWENSKGASIEHEKAKTMGLVIGDLDYWAPMIKWIGESRFEPVQGYEGDAGYDLIVAETTRIDYRGWADVPMGISIELPRGHWAMIVGRSSTIRKRQLVVNTAIIDNGYRGPIFAATSNYGSRIAVVEKGERIAQIIPMPLTSASLTLGRVAELSPSERGTKAFGSTGQ